MNQYGRPTTLAPGVPLWRTQINTTLEDLEGNTESPTDDEYTDSTCWKFAVISDEQYVSMRDSTKPRTTSSCDTFDEYGEGLDKPSYLWRKDQEEWVKTVHNDVKGVPDQSLRKLDRDLDEFWRNHKKIWDEILSELNQKDGQRP